jgi:2-polyprenyl-6-hydroxyphenyl methylase / 3-demethylubiquinone-9 3-methyltransferase
MSTTINPAEVTRFEQLAATWWQEDGPMWPLHKLNQLRAPYVTEQICTHLGIESAGAKPLAGLSILDIGCGAGLLAEEMAKRGAIVTAIDPAERNVAIAHTHAGSQGLSIDYRTGSVDALHPSEQFDVVLNMEVVEHVDNLSSFIATCCAHTRPGGLHFIATINRTFVSLLVAIIGAEYILRWLPKGTHQ